MKKINLRSLLPNLITLSGLSFGLSSMRFAIRAPDMYKEKLLQSNPDLVTCLVSRDLFTKMGVFTILMVFY